MPHSWVRSNLAHQKAYLRVVSPFPELPTHLESGCSETLGGGVWQMGDSGEQCQISNTVAWNISWAVPFLKQPDRPLTKGVLETTEQNLVQSRQGKLALEFLRVGAKWLFSSDPSSASCHHQAYSSALWPFSGKFTWLLCASLLYMTSVVPLKFLVAISQRVLKLWHWAGI